MMKSCEWRENGEQCAQWAQWRATYPDKVTRKLCNAHKREQEKQNEGCEEHEKVKFIFAGAIPSGIDDP